MTITSNQELFRRIAEVARILRDLGARDFAGDLEAAVKVSSVPGEVLGEINLELFKLQSTEWWKHPQVEPRVVDIKSALELALRLRRPT